MADVNMSSRLKILLLPILCSMSVNVNQICSNPLSTSETFYHPVEVVPYRQYKSISLLQHQVPPRVSHIQWRFIGTKASPSCKMLNITVRLQPRGAALVNPRNETFPAHFYLHRSASYRLLLAADGDVTTFNVTSPVTGSWFAVAFLNDESQAITVTKSCKYHLQMNVTSSFLPDSIRLMGTNHIARITLLRSVSYFSFFSHAGTWRHLVSVSACSVNGTSRSRCPVLLHARTHALPDATSATVAADCTDVAAVCRLTLDRPEVNEWVYLKVTKVDGVQQVTFDLRDFTDDCSGDPLDIPDDGESSSNCGQVAPLERVENRDDAFSVVYTLAMGRQTEVVRMIDSRPQVVSFEVAPLKDTGGTLRVKVDFYKRNTSSSSSSSSGADNSSLTLVTICLQRGVIPTNGSDLRCPDDSRLELSSERNGSDGTEVERFIPYPEAGTWFIGMQAFCYDTHSRRRQRCANQTTLLFLTVKSEPCVRSKCGEHGECRLFFQGVYFFSTCVCFAGWRGYGCTDGRHAKTRALQLTYTLLLVLSNFAFIPAIVLATYRRHLVEALVYAANMGFSALYHACDMRSWSVYRACVMPYNVLSYADFFLSILSFVVTFIAMSQQPLRRSAPLRIIAVCFLVVAVEWRKHSLVTFLIPCAYGIFILATTWGYLCYKTRACYPGKWRLLGLAPGAAIAVVGMCVFAFVETDDNYPYSHSAWHVCIATSILFLLPPRRREHQQSSSSEFELSGLSYSDGVGLISAAAAAGGRDARGGSTQRVSHHDDDIIL